MKICKIMVYSLVFISFLFGGICFLDSYKRPCIFEEYIHKNPHEEIDYYVSATSETGLININTASVNELSELPGIGGKLSQRIVEFRNKNGNFEVIEDMLKVPGIGEKMFDAIKPYITIK